MSCAAGRRPRWAPWRSRRRRRCPSSLHRRSCVAVQVRRRADGDEELRSVRVRAGVRHREQVGPVESELRVEFVGELVARPPRPPPSGSPPWIMKPSMTRWKTVPSYNLVAVFDPLRGSFHSLVPSASSTKFATVFGAWSAKSLISMSPFVVCKVAKSRRPLSDSSGRCADTSSSHATADTVAPYRGHEPPGRARITDRRGAGMAN